MRKIIRPATLLRKLSVILQNNTTKGGMRIVNYKPRYRLSRAMLYIVDTVNNNEAQILKRTLIDSTSTSDDIEDTLIDFIRSLDAFNNYNYVLDFLDTHLLEGIEYDDTRISDVPDYYLISSP